MRLTAEQIQIITQVVLQRAGKTAAAYLFGSRLNDRARGGDVDILVETDRHLSRIELAGMIMKLENALGLPVNVVVHVRKTEPTPFQIIARSHAARLEART